MWCIYTPTHTHTLEYHSVIYKKYKALLLAIKHMEVEAIMLDEINQRHRNAYMACCSSHMEAKDKNNSSSSKLSLNTK